MDDPSVPDKDKLKSLQSLNTMLLKETVLKREEIDGLKAEVEALKAETAVVREVVTVYMEEQVVRVLRREKEAAEKRLEEVEREMGEVVKERDEVEKLKFDGDYEIGLMKKLEIDLRNEIRREKEGASKAIRERNELRNEASLMTEELEGLKGRLEVSAKALEEKEKEGEMLRSELSLMGKSCEELRKEIEGLRWEMELVSKSNEGLCKERDEKNVRVSELEKEVEELNGAVLRVRKEEEEEWRARFMELEKGNAGTLVELEEVKRGLSDLMEERVEKEREIERLIGEKSIVEARLGEVEKELELAKQVGEELVETRSKLEEMKHGLSVSQDALIEAQEELSSLKESYTSNLEDNQRLASEIDHHENELVRVTSERDAVKRTLDEEKKNGMMLRVKVSEISKKMEETAKVIEDLRAASDTLVGEKKEIENKHSKLMEDKEKLDKDCAGYKGLVKELEESMRAKTEMLELVVAMVRKTVGQLSMESEKKSENEGIKINGEVEPILVELEAMRSVFKRKEEKVGEIQQKMESLHSCLLEEKKKKSFWTLVSSATTILAAVVSFAYASRVR